MLARMNDDYGTRPGFYGGFEGCVRREWAGGNGIFGTGHHEDGSNGAGTIPFSMDASRIS